MSKTINNLTAEEFSAHFPVKLLSYSSEWQDLFCQEKKNIASCLGPNLALRIEHFGSTAVPGLASKPIIDILLEIPMLNDLEISLLTEKLSALNYVHLTRFSDRFSHIMYAKGYAMDGNHGQFFHIHAGEKNNDLWDRILFRDYLIRFPEARKAYEQLKYNLAEKYEFDRDSYSFAKTEFIAAITQKAKNLRSAGLL